MPLYCSVLVTSVAYGNTLFAVNVSSFISSPFSPTVIGLMAQPLIITVKQRPIILVFISLTVENFVQKSAPLIYQKQKRVVSCLILILGAVLPPYSSFFYQHNLVQTAKQFGQNVFPVLLPTELLEYVYFRHH